MPLFSLASAAYDRSPTSSPPTLAYHPHVHSASQQQVLATSAGSIRHNTASRPSTTPGRHFLPLSLSHPRSPILLCLSLGLCCCNVLASPGAVAGLARAPRPNTISPTNRAYLETTSRRPRPRHRHQTSSSLPRSSGTWTIPFSFSLTCPTPARFSLGRSLSVSVHSTLLRTRSYIPMRTWPYVHRNIHMYEFLLLLL